MPLWAPLLETDGWSPAAEQSPGSSGLGICRVEVAEAVVPTRGCAVGVSECWGASRCPCKPTPSSPPCWVPRRPRVEVPTGSVPRGALSVAFWEELSGWEGKKGVKSGYLLPLPPGGSLTDSGKVYTAGPRFEF